MPLVDEFGREIVSTEPSRESLGETWKLYAAFAESELLLEAAYPGFVINIPKNH